LKLSRKSLLSALLVLPLLLFLVGVVLMHSSPGVPVLNYHQVEQKNGNPLTLWPDQFEAQMAYLADEGYTTITIDEMMDALENGTPLPEKPVIITFDDGYADNYEYAYPILKKYGFKATIFLIYDFTNTYPNYLTWEQINEMKESGLIHFESHTMTHANLAELNSADELRHEIADSHDLLSEKLGYDMHYIAYPGGRPDAVRSRTCRHCARNRCSLRRFRHSFRCSHPRRMRSAAGKRIQGPGPGQCAFCAWSRGPERVAKKNRRSMSCVQERDSRRRDVVAREVSGRRR